MGASDSFQLRWGAEGRVKGWLIITVIKLGMTSEGRVREGGSSLKLSRLGLGGETSQFSKGREGGRQSS